MTTPALAVLAIVVTLWLGAAQYRDTWFGEALVLLGFISLIVEGVALLTNWPPMVGQ
jgi:hypothetical protein